MIGVCILTAYSEIWLNEFSVYSRCQLVLLPSSFPPPACSSFPPSLSILPLPLLPRSLPSLPLFSSFSSPSSLFHLHYYHDVNVYYVFLLVLYTMPKIVMNRSGKSGLILCILNISFSFVINYNVISLY